MRARKNCKEEGKRTTTKETNKENETKEKCKVEKSQ